MQKHCQIPTPIEYVRTMLDLAGYTENLYGKTILENSCGEGRILIEIVRRYIEDCRKNNYSDESIIKGIQKDIKAYEIDPQCVKKCIERLDDLAAEMNLEKIHWNIKTEDYLETGGESFDYIIGNPPYVTYHLLKEEERSQLKGKFESCLHGRFDYSYAFVEKSINSLNQQGVLVYLIPYSIFRNKFAHTLREMIKRDLISIIDYSGINVFGDVTASAAIIHLIKGSDGQTMIYRKGTDTEHTLIRKETLAEKWHFIPKTSGKRFGDYYTVQNSVATLYNKAFLISEYEDDEAYVVVDGYKIEKAILRNAVSTKSCKKKDGKDRIIFPYRNHDGSYERITESDMEKNFPGALRYLGQFSANLDERDSSEGVLWYEYGRTQALSEIYGEKLIISMVITTKVTAYMADAESVPYAGYFIKAKNEQEYDLNFAKQLLEAPEFYEYVQNVGTPTTETSFRISVKDIENYTFNN